MAFVETLFPDCFMFGSSGGPAYLTEVDVTTSGAEFRIGIRDEGLCSWQVGLVSRPLSQFHDFLKWFRAMRGRLHGFRVKDPFDNVASAAEGILVQIGVTNTYQMFKRYQPAGVSIFEDKIIYKPLANVVIAGSGSFSVDTTSGIVTAASGTPTGWSGGFHKPARFDSDEMSTPNIVSRQGGASGEILVEWPSIMIVEQASKD